jgi:hypothetical protein
MDTQFIPTLSANRFLPDIDANLEADDDGQTYVGEAEHRTVLLCVV